MNWNYLFVQWAQNVPPYFRPTFTIRVLSLNSARSTVCPTNSSTPSRRDRRGVTASLAAGRHERRRTRFSAFASDDAHHPTRIWTATMHHSTSIRGELDNQQRELQREYRTRCASMNGEWSSVGVCVLEVCYSYAMKSSSRFTPNAKLKRSLLVCRNNT